RFSLGELPLLEQTQAQVRECPCDERMVRLHPTEELDCLAQHRLGLVELPLALVHLGPAAPEDVRAHVLFALYPVRCFQPIATEPLHFIQLSLLEQQPGEIDYGM